MLNGRQAITRTNDDQDIGRHMVSLGHNELTNCGLVKPYGDIHLIQPWLRVLACCLTAEDITWIHVD